MEAKPTGFWHKPTSITLNLPAISKLSEEEARMELAAWRWGSREEQVCPECGVVDSHYVIRTRRQWRCRGCKATFSVTSKSPFADHKISHQKLLMAFFLFATHHKGMPALELMRSIGVDYKTAFTLLHKIRDALTRSVPAEKLTGVIEMDGAHFSGRPRKGRRRRYRKKPPGESEGQGGQHRTRLPNKAFPYHPNRRIVIVMRQNEVNGSGAQKTVVAICRSENANDVHALIHKWIQPSSTVRTDELPAYKNLPPLLYNHEFVNHSVEFSTDTGVNENQAESFFSRMRRSEIGVYHRITPHYMLDYANEMAWREEMRRTDTAAQLKNLVSRTFNAGISPDWRAYSHGHRRQVELLFAA